MIKQDDFIDIDQRIVKAIKLIEYLDAVNRLDADADDLIHVLEDARTVILAARRDIDVANSKRFIPDPL